MGRRRSRAICDDETAIAAASNVLAARDHYAVADPYERPETPDSRPTFGLDDGETDGIVTTRTSAAGQFAV